jgi:hypothetical protein
MPPCRHAAGLLDGALGASQRTIALDGKVLRRSFDNFTDGKAAHDADSVVTRSRVLVTERTTA